MSAGVSKKKKKKKEKKETREGRAWQRAERAEGNRVQRGNISHGIDAPVALLLRWITNNGVVSIYSRSPTHTFRFEHVIQLARTHWSLPFGSVHGQSHLAVWTIIEIVLWRVRFCPCTLLNRRIDPMVPFSVFPAGARDGGTGRRWYFQ